MNCQEFTRMFASDGLPEAGLLARLEARLHLFVCRYCRCYAAQLRTFGAWARRTWGAMGRDSGRLSELESRILKRIFEQSAGTASSGPPNEGC